MKYLAVLGRQPEISLAELKAIFQDVKQISGSLATFSSVSIESIARLGGTLKLGAELEVKPLDYLSKLPEGKITIGVSDYSKKASRVLATKEALKLKKILVRHGRSVRVVENKDAVLSTAASLHNGLSGKNERKVELIKTDDGWYKVIGVQDIDAYARRDQARPARDAKVGMLPPKLAQILINLCGPLKPGATVLDPFCGTGVVLQEALLLGYRAYGTDINERMIEYTRRNLEHLLEFENCSIRGNPERGSARTSAGRPWRRDNAASENRACSVLRARQFRHGTRRAGRTRPENEQFQIFVGDAMNFTWQQPIDAVACEGYLGKPMSVVPPEIKLKTEKQECGAIVLGFLKNLIEQIKPGTPVVIAVPAWLRQNGTYSRLEILDLIADMGYNVNNQSREGLLYARVDQVVARDIIILRKD